VNLERVNELVLLCQAVPFESPSSWITRAAQVQGTTVTALVHHMGMRATRDFDRTIAALFTRKLSRSLPPIRGLAIGCRVVAGIRSSLCEPRRFLLTVKGGNRFRFCPLCLAEQPTPHFPQHWRFAAWRYCPTHQCVLEDVCFNCKSPVTLPSTLATAGAKGKGVADLSYCTTCGKSLSAVETAALLGPNHENLASHWERKLLENGRAALASLYFGKVFVDGQFEALPRRHLRTLDMLGLIPNGAVGLSADDVRARIERRPVL